MMPASGSAERTRDRFRLSRTLKKHQSPGINARMQKAIVTSMMLTILHNLFEHPVLLSIVELSRRRSILWNYGGLICSALNCRLKADNMATSRKMSGS